MVKQVSARAMTRIRMRTFLGSASVAAMALGTSAHAQTEAANAQTGIVSGGTHTTVTPATGGSAVTVATTRIGNAKGGGKVGFNDFSKFELPKDNSVTLLLPTGANTLVNVVAGNVKVDGTLTSRLVSESGTVGGNLFFVTSGGMFVGSTGVINTGRLIVRGGTLDTASAASASGGFNLNSLTDAASSIVIDGRINAPGGIDLKAGSVTIGAGAGLYAGAAAMTALPGADVSVLGLVEGKKLVKVDGGIAIVGEDAVTAMAGSTLDARAGTAGTTPLGGGIDLLSNGAIKLGGTLTAWDGTSADAADITVAATKSVTIGDQFAGVGATLLANYYTNSTAQTSLDVTGSITGGTVSLTSDATASTATDFNPYVTTLQFLGDYLKGQVLNAVGLDLDVLVTRADARSAVTIGSAAKIKAAGDLTVSATSTANAEGQAEAELEGSSAFAFGIAVGVAQVNSAATATVNGQLDAGGKLIVSASNDATSKLEVTAKSSAQAKAAAVAYTEAKVDATVSVGAAAKLTGESVEISALNRQAYDEGDEETGFDTTATTLSVDGSAGGGTAAVTKLDIAANATVAGAVTSTGTGTGAGGVAIRAETNTNHVINAARADTQPDNADGEHEETLETIRKAKAGDKETLLTLALGGFANAFDTLVLGKDEDEADTPESARFGAAVGVLLDKQTANVAVTGSVAATGAVAVDSLVKDASVRNNVKAAVAAEEETGGTHAVAGAAAWSRADYRSHATVGGTVTAAGLAVNAETLRERGTEFDLEMSDKTPGENALDFASEPLAKLGDKLALVNGFFGNAAGASADTDGDEKSAVSGSVSYIEIGADTRAWIDPLTVLTLTGDLAVKANTAITLLNLAGALPSETGGLFTTKGGNAGGVAVAFTKIDPTTIAGIGRGVLLNQPTAAGAVNVNVGATAAVNAITLAPQAGKGNAKTGSGTFATNMIGGTTRATISKDARLDLGTGTLGLNALTELSLWTVGGSVAVTDTGGGDAETAMSAGVAGALNDVEFDTRARVADAGGDDASGAAALTVAQPGVIVAGTVNTGAVTKGGINAISVAGVATTNGPTAVAAGADGGADEAKEKKGAFGKTADKLEIAAALLGSPLLQGAADYAKLAEEYTSKLEGAVDKADDATSRGSATKGYGLAGSASINLSDLTTRVETTGATFRRATAGTGGFTARAVEAVDMMSITGGAAISTGKSMSDGAHLLAGAYGLSYSNNATGTALTSTALTGFGNVAVEAAANGSRIAAGLSLAADATGSKESRALAGSVSHLIARDGATASVTDGSITGAGAGTLSILAYNGLTMGAGAGGLSWANSKAIGGAATVIDVKGPAGTDAAAARLTRTPVGQFADVSVRALTAARIAGIAAAGAVAAGNSSSTALTAGLSLNLVSFDSSAIIDTGETGVGTIAATGAVSVFAGDLDPARPEALAASGRSTATAGSGYLGRFALGAADFSGDDPIQTGDLKGGTQILSIAVPVSGSKGKAIGVGFAWNEIDNDRTAAIVGGAATPGAATITAGTVSVQAVERSDILALGVGVGASTGGAGLMGSASRNLIEGSSSAGIGRAAGAANNLGIAITSAPSTTPSVSVGASGEGGIFSLAGAVGVGKGAAGGVAVGVNEITRASSAGTGGLDVPSAQAGLRAAIDGVSFSGNPDVDVLAAARGRIVGSAIAVAGSTSKAAIAGAASVNTIAPTIAASASRLDYATASSGDLKVRGRDESSILSNAIVLGVGNKGAAALGVTVNRIDADVSAALRTAAGDRVQVRNLLVDTYSTAKTTAFGIGAGGGSKFGGAGSVVVNLTDSDVSSLLSYTGGTIAATGSVGVVAKRDLTIDVGAGVLAGAVQGAAIGASVIVNDLGGSADARIVGAAANTGTITAGGTGPALDGLRTGGLDRTPAQFDDLNGFKNLALPSMIQASTASFKGVAVNAASTAATRTIAVTGAIAGSGAAVGVTGVINNTTGTTNASITDAKVRAGSATAAQAGVGIDVRASSQQVGLTFAGAIAGSSNVGVAAPVISDGYAGRTTALVSGGALSAADTVAVKAIAGQVSTTLALAGAVGGNAAAAVAGVSPRFQAVTTATIDKPTALVALGTGGVAVNADARSSAFATFGTLALGGNGAGAAAVVVATNSSETAATYNGLATTAVDAAKIAVTADGAFDAMVAGASAAASAQFALVGNGVGVVHRGTVTATADHLNYNRATGGSVDVRAAEKVSIVPIVGQAAIAATPISGAASLGAIAILGQSKVDARLTNPSITADTVTVDAKGWSQVDALQFGVAVGGIGLGANVTYIGIGEITDTGALLAANGDGSEDSKVSASAGSSNGGNSNMKQLAVGSGRSSSDIAGSGDTTLTAAERNRAAGSDAARTAFTTAGSADNGASQARVLAEVSGTGTINARTKLTVDSDANLLSKSTNVQVSGGIAAGSATIGITRNAVQSIASLGGVDARGGALEISATTGEARATGAAKTVSTLTNAAQADIWAGSIGVGALSVGLADVKLQSAAKADLTAAARFATIAVTADDSTTAVTNARGAAAGGGAVNVVISKAVKDGLVTAGIGSGSTVTTTGALDVAARALGGATSTAYAASGGLLFAGNAAKSVATDSRIVRAAIGENTIVSGASVAVKATSTPLVSAKSFGVAVSGGVAAGASIAEASSDGKVSALVGEGGLIAGTLTIAAEAQKRAGGDNVSATASGSAGGVLAAASGSDAKATTTLTTEAVLGANMAGGVGNALTQSGTLSIYATREIAQFAEATGVTAAGVLAIGIQRAEAASYGDTRAAIANVDGGARTTLQDATLASKVLDHNRANVTAGAGGLGAGIAADAITKTLSTATTEITTPGGADNVFVARTLTATALVQADYKATSDATLATAAGASGTTSDNTVDQVATLNIGRGGDVAKGANSRFYATGYVLSAGALIDGGASGDGGYAKGAGGGVVTGQAALLKNTITQTANVNLNDGITLRQAGGDASENVRATFIDAYVEQGRTHKVALDVGGAMQLPFGEIQGNYNARNNVRIGDDVLIRGDSGIGIGTHAVQGFVDTVAVQIYGLAGLGGGKTTVTGDAKSDLVVGNGTTIESLMDIRVSTGISADEAKRDAYSIIAQTDTFNNTALPLTSEAGAVANVKANNTLTIGASTIRSARDVTVESKTSAGSPSAAGTGHNPYLELLSQTTKGGSTSTKVDSAIRLNGSQLTAGYINDRTITIDYAADRNAATTLDGVALANSAAGYTITTNNALYHDAGDADWLGQFTIEANQFNAKTFIDQQIAALTAKARALGLDVDNFKDPASVSAANRQAARDVINAGSVKSDVLAQLGTLFETRAALVQSGVGDRAAVVVGGSLSGKEINGGSGVFAAGGRVSLGSNAITGDGAAKVTTFGAPTIKVTNNTGLDTVLGNMFIPFKVNGGLDLTGAAQELGSGITWVKPAEAGQPATAAGITGDPSIIVKTGNERSDIVALGNINNIAGLFRASTTKGNYVQFGAVNVASFSADAPNGLFTVSMPTGTFSMGLPISYYYGDPRYISLFSVSRYGGETAGRTYDPERAIELIASYVGNKFLGLGGVSVSEDTAKAQFAGKYGNINDVYSRGVLHALFLDDNHILESTGGAGGKRGGTKWDPVGMTIWGSCIVGACEILSNDDNIGNTSGVTKVSNFIFNGDSDSDTYADDYIYTVGVQYKNPVLVGSASGRPYPATGNSDPNFGSTDTKNAITATQVIINAQYVDVSGEIKAGPVKDRQLTIRDSYSANGSSYSFGAALGNAGGATASNYDLLLSNSGYQFGTGRNLGAQFVRTGVTTRADGSRVAEGYIQVDDVIAGGGGSITIAGKILNTNPVGGGKLTVLNGYGNINIDNQTGYEIRVKTINAGLSADGRITLRDNGMTTEYTNSVGGQVSMTQYVPVYTGEKDRNGLDVVGTVTKTTTEFGNNQGLVGGDGLYYRPVGNFYYVWHERQNIQRTINAPTAKTTGTVNASSNDQGITTWTATPWAYDTRAYDKDNPNAGGYSQQAPNIGGFINVGAGGADANAIIQAQGANGRADFVQVVTGGVTDRVQVNFDDYADCSGCYKSAYFDLPTRAYIDVMSAAKATYPIRIQFDQGSGSGGINIKSNAGGNIRLEGPLTFGGGLTAIETNRDILVDPKALVTSKSISLSAGGAIGSFANPVLDRAEAPFQANLLGGYFSAYSGTSINVALKSGDTLASGAPAPIGIGTVRAAGDVKIAADTAIAGVANPAAGYHVRSDNGNVTLDVAGSITGDVNYRGDGSLTLTTAALKIDTLGSAATLSDLQARGVGMVTVRAVGDVAIEQVGRDNVGTDRVLRLAAIETPGDVLVKAPGSIIAADATATVDQEKLARFLSAASSLQLAPSCKTSCGEVNPMALGGLDRLIRDLAYAAYDRYYAAEASGGTPAEREAIRTAAERELNDYFGFGVPASRDAIATTRIVLDRDKQIALQLRNQGKDAYDRYALTNAAATAEDSRGTAVGQTLGALDKIAAFTARGGFTLTADGKAVTLAAAGETELATLLPGGDLYRLAVATLTTRGIALAGEVATRAEIKAGLDDYLAGLREPVAALLPDALPTLDGLTGDARAAAVSAAISGAALTRWVSAQNLVTQRERASADALGKLELIDAFARKGAGVSADGRTIALTDADFARIDALKPGNELYELGLATLRAKVNENGLREKVPLPTNKDIVAGLQLYLDQLRAPLDGLIPGALPVLTGATRADRLAAVSAAISGDNLTAWANRVQADAVKELGTIYAALPVGRTSLGTAALNVGNLTARTGGATWSQTMLDVQVPSTAFVPVADSQIEFRKPVIVARGVSLVAGNSIGAFDPQLTIKYNSSGFAGTTSNGVAVTGERGSKDLAAAYLASSGPGDLKTSIVYKKDASGNDLLVYTKDASGNDIPGTGRKVVDSVSFTTRRDQPLQLTASGTVNAVAATDPTSMASSVTGAGSTVQGDIFLNNTTTLHLGSVVSQKWKTGTAEGCNIGTAAASSCDSRIRLVASDILGVAAGAAAVRSGGTLLSNADGSALVMGGLVRMEAGSGSIVRAATTLGGTTGAISVDAIALEVLRAANDIKLTRRASVEIPTAAGGYRFASAVYQPDGSLADQGVADGWMTRAANTGWAASVSNLRLGDAFAGRSLSIDNPYGGLFVVALPSTLESENRNSRIVTEQLSLRAAGDIGSATQTSAGLVGQFDIQSPFIEQFMTGYDFASGAPAMGAAPAGLGTGSGFFALRGVSQIGRQGDSAPGVGPKLGARGSITIGTLNNDQDSASVIKSAVRFLGHITVGGSLNLTTDGDVAFPDENVRITGLGVAVDPTTVDLRALKLTLKGKFDYVNSRNIILGSLTAGGGTIESRSGKVTVTGTLYGTGGVDSPFTMKGLKGVEIGDTGNGAVALLAEQGDVRVNGVARATDFTAVGDNIYLASGLYGRNASLTADAGGVVRIGGSVFLQRDETQPGVRSEFKLSGGALALDDMVSAQDMIDVRGTSIAVGSRSMFLNTGELNLIATGALSIDPRVAFTNIGTATLRSGNAAAGGTTVSLASFSGGALDILAPVGIAIGSTSVSNALTLRTGGQLAFNGGLMAGGAIDAGAGTIQFASAANIRDAGSVALAATQAINASTATLIRSRGDVTISTADNLSLGQVQANGGSITVSNGGLTLGSTFVSNGADYRIQAARAVSVAGAITTLGNFGINAGGDLSLTGAVTMNGGNGLSGLDLDAGGVLTLGRNAKVTARAQTSSVRITAGSVAMDSLASITGAAVSLTSRGAAVLGDIRASEANAQTVSLRANGALSVGALTGGTTTITASAGTATMRAAAKVGALTVTARDDIVANGIAATAATLNASTGSVTLNGVTRVLRPDAPTAARLSVTAGKTIEMTGATGATGGMTLTGATVKTSGSGYLTDIDLAGALTTLRADAVDVRFDTGAATGAALRIDARGRTQSSIADAKFIFATNRPITFDSLWVQKGEVQSSTALSVTSLTMRDYLLVGRAGATVALVGQGTAPSASRTAQTGALSAAKLVVTPGSGATAVSVNGAAK